MEFLSWLVIIIGLVSVIFQRRQGGQGKNGNKSEREGQRGQSQGGPGSRQQPPVNAVGEQARMDRAQQRANAVGETPARTRQQRRVEEQRARAETYRRQQEEASRPVADYRMVDGPTSSSSASSSSASSASASSPAPRAPRQQAPAAYSYSDGDRPLSQPTPLTEAPPSATPALSLPPFTRDNVRSALVMAEILGPCKARRQGR